MIQTTRPPVRRPAPPPAALAEAEALLDGQPHKALSKADSEE